MARTLRALVIGGGTGGMCAAITLRRIGVEVDLVDIDPGWRVAGAGITITGATLRALKAVGVYDEVAAQGYVGEGIRVCTVDGTFVRDLPTPMPAGSGVAGCGGVTRPVLHGILSSRVRASGTHVRLGTAVETLEQDATGVSIVLSDGTAERYDLVLGADGLNSRTRRQILPEAPHPVYTGQSTWRMFVPRPSEVDRRHFFLGGAHKVGFTPVSDTQMYLFVTEKTERVRREPEELAPTLRRLLEGYGGYIADIRESITADSQVVFRPLEAFVLPPPWHVGRVLLIGDAAHPTTPQLASGAGLAVEDALVLAEELQAHSFDVAAAWNAFFSRREERCRLVVETSVKIGELEQLRAPASEQTALVDAALARLAGPI